MSRSPELEARAADIIARYPERRSAVMPLLYLAISDDGHLTDEGMEWVAERTGITPAQVLSVASFYVMYKREAKGKYLISVCTSISCFLLGSDDVLQAVQETAGVPAGESDDVIAVEHAECIGACGGAPACMVNFELIEGVTPETAAELVRYLRENQPEVINTDDLQDRFGGQRSFDWAIREENGAVGPFPAFGPLGTAAVNTPALEPGREGNRS